MPNCSSSYTTEIVQHSDPACMQLCAGISFTVHSVTTGNNKDGSCTFSWSISRSDGEMMRGSESVPCGEKRSVEFFCDSGGSCVGFRLNLVCGDAVST